MTDIGVQCGVERREALKKIASLEAQGIIKDLDFTRRTKS